jgi:ABC-type polysaccharide/polyol phosphate transport system ATPase subunit
MARWHTRHHHHHHVELPPDVLLSVQGVSRVAVSRMPEIPKWLVRVLPKSGIAGQTSLDPNDLIDDEDDDDALDDDDEDEFDAEPLTLNEISFDVRAGEGVGIVGPNQQARKALLQILFGGIPPTTGRIVVRGRVAPLLRSDVIKYTSKEWGEKAVFLAARFLHWPQKLLHERWDEILEFAQLRELSGLGPGKYRQNATTRLLFSAALHMDASVYVLDHGIDFDPDFALRCFDLIEQRQREGAAVVHGAQKMIADVSRLCGEVLWLEKDGTVIRGRPVDVAIAVQKLDRDELHPLSTPVLATLEEEKQPVQVPGMIEIELHTLRKDIVFAFTLELKDDAERVIEIEQPDQFEADAAGLHHLRIRIPGDHVPDGTYRAKLIAAVGVVGAEPTGERELLTFELVSRNGDMGSAGDAVQFELVPKDEAIQVSTPEIEASVSRTVS